MCSVVYITSWVLLSCPSVFDARTTLSLFVPATGVSGESMATAMWSARVQQCWRRGTPRRCVRMRWWSCLDVVTERRARTGQCCVFLFLFLFSISSPLVVSSYLHLFLFETFLSRENERLASFSFFLLLPLPPFSSPSPSCCTSPSASPSCGAWTTAEVRCLLCDESCKDGSLCHCTR